MFLFCKEYCLIRLTNKRFLLRSITEKNTGPILFDPNLVDVINAGFKCFSGFDECEDLIPHFIICTSFRMSHLRHDSTGHDSWAMRISGYKETFKEIFWAKMREYGVRSAILTIINLRRYRLTSKDEVKQKYRDAHEADIYRSLNEDLEYFYDSRDSIFIPKFCKIVISVKIWSGFDHSF